MVVLSYEKMMETKAKVTAYYTGERRLVETRSEVARILILFLGLIPAMLASLTLTWDYLDFGTLVIGAAGFVYAVLEFAVLNEVLKRWYVMKHPVAAVVAAYIPALFVIVVSALMCDYFVAGALQFVTVLLTVFILGTLAFVCAIIRKRSDYGQKVLEEVLGFREFLDKVEIDKLKMMMADIISEEFTNNGFMKSVMDTATLTGHQTPSHNVGKMEVYT